MSFLGWFNIRKKIKEHQIEKKKSQEYRILKSKQKEFKGIMDSYHKITYDLNPFLYTPIEGEVKYIEDIKINYQDFFDDEKTVFYIVRNPYVKRKQRKLFVDEIMKKWEYDFYKDIDKQLKRTLEQASFIPVKKVEKIKNRRINYHMFIALLFLILLRQYSVFQTLPLFGGLFTKINTLFIHQKYYTIASLEVYLSIFISIYLIIVKVYFDKVLSFGLTAKGFLIKERDRMLKRYLRYIKKIKKHLYRLSKKIKMEEKFPLNSNNNSKNVIKRIRRYGQTVIHRVMIFTNYYNIILSISKLLQLIHLGIIMYLIVQLFLVNDIHLFGI